ncbi:MAG TPA: AAA family ATPase [Candidatus Cybelea sp.]|jgi:DNA-binding SARP family transcriptional activator|nr:AAA family ATPase [Candidatus Cybelea sp.]
MLEMRLFGAGRIFDDRGEIKIVSRRWTLPLLAYLLFARGKPVLRRRLAFALWPDEPEETALVNLRRNLHRLREMLEPRDGDGNWIRLENDSVSWNASAPCRVDFLAYEELRADPARVEEAVGLYAGDLLEDFFDDWIATERERLRGCYQADLSALVVVKRSRRAFAQAAQFATQLLQSDPWREDALRALMSVRYEAGDASGALAEYDRFVRLLNDEMGAVPMPETIALRDAVARGEPIFPASETTPAEIKPAREDVPFVGRQDELGNLRAAWTRAASGNGGLHFVRGEAGMGKSRLVSELALRAEAEGGRVIGGTTSRPERSPYQCLSSALRSRLPLVSGVALAPPLLAALAELVPELRSFRDDIPPLVRLDPEREQNRLFDALAQALVALSRPRPLIVILEDLHRAEPTTIDALRGIAPRLGRSAVLLVVTYRPEEVSRAHPLHALVRAFEGDAASTEVRSLTEDDVRTIAEVLAPEEAARSGFVATLTHRSEGNALFVTELLREAKRAGHQQLTTPASVQAVIAERLGTLAPATRTVAEVASVAGEAFSVGIVQEIAGLTQGKVLDALDELLDRHVVRESDDRGHYEYVFTHHLVHAVVYDESAPQPRVRRHRRVARLLDEASAPGFNERAAEIALHYERGGEAAKAAGHYARAARHAVGLYANAEARDLVGRALDLGAWSARERFELLLLRSAMHANLGEAAAQSADLDEAQQLADGLDADARCAVLDRRIRLAARQAGHEQELDAIDRLTREAARASDERWAAVADELRARRQERDGELERSLESALRALERFAKTGDDEARARLGAYAARVSVLVPGRASEADRLVREALRVTESGSAAAARWTVLYDAVVVAYERHEHQRATELGRAALDLSRQTGNRVNETNARHRLGVALWTCWQIAQSLEELNEAARLAQELGLVQRFAGIACDLGAVLIPVGDFASGVEWSRRALELHRASTSRTSASLAAVAAANIAEAEYLRGDLEALAAAIEDAAPLIASLPESRFRSALLQAQGRLLRCRRQFDESLAKLEDAFALDERLARWENAAQELDDLALTYLGAGRVADASRALERSVALVGGRSRPDEVMHHWIEACVHRAAGDAHRARAAVRTAFDTYARKRAALGDVALQAFFEAMAVHRAIRLAHEHDEWPRPGTPCVVALAGSERSRNAAPVE